MEPSVEIFVPSRLYGRAGWLILATSAAFLTFGISSLALLIPGAILAVSAVVFLWLSSRPFIRVGETQFNIGERSIAWREVKEMNRIRLPSLLILRLKLTNSRKKLLIYPGDISRVEQLVHLLRKNSHLATFDGVAYRDYWTWSSMTGIHAQNQPGQTAPKPLLEQPVRMLTSEEEDEIERMFQKLKAVGSLDSRLDPINSDED